MPITIFFLDLMSLLSRHDTYERTDSVHDHNSRGCQHFRLLTGTKTLSNMGARVWNAISNKIYINTSRAVFMDKLTLFVWNTASVGDLNETNTVEPTDSSYTDYLTNPIDSNFAF